MYYISEKNRTSAFHLLRVNAYCTYMNDASVFEKNKSRMPAFPFFTSVGTIPLEQELSGTVTPASENLDLKVD